MLNHALLGSEEPSTRILQAFERFRFESLHVSNAPQLIEKAELDPELQVIFLHGPPDPSLASQVRLLRHFPYYLYLIYLSESLEVDPAPLIEAGIDEVLLVDQLPSSLQVRLLALDRFFKAHSIDLDLINLPADRSARQTLNLETGLTFADKDKHFYQTLLGVLLKNLRELASSFDHGLIEGWQNLAQNARSLGAENLSDWTDDFFTHKRLRQRSRSSSIKRLKQRFKQLKGSLNIAVEQLNSAGYFETDQPSNNPDFFQGLKILVVEDMAHNRLLLQHILDRKGCKIIEAVNGAKGLEVIKSTKVDLVLMDMNMPVMDGFSATKALRDWENKTGRQRLPVLALTALAMRGDKEKCLAVGCDAYLPKPVDSQDLYEKIRQLASPHQEQLAALATTNLKTPLNLVIYTNNQVYQFVLHRFCNQLGLEPRFFNSEVELIKVVQNGDCELVLLDQERSIKLAYLIRDRYPSQQVNLFGENFDLRDPQLLNSDHVVEVPFQIDQLRTIFEFHQAQLEQRQRYSEIIEDFNSLKLMKGQTGIQELVSHSEGQLAAWQKAFRKIGGDLVLSQSFDFHGRLGLILADVSGHDVRSGYTAAWFAGLIRGIWKNHPAPYDLLVYLNSHFNPDQLEEDTRYVCALVLLWDPLNKKLSWANAGIPGGILLRADGSREELSWRGVPIGMFPDMQQFDQGELQLSEGDSLILATDGVLEAVPGDVIQQLSLSGDTPDELLDQVVDFVVRSLEVKDDLTLAVMRPKEMLLPEGRYRHKMVGTLEETYVEVTRIKTFLDSVTEINFDWPMCSVAIKESLMNSVEHGNKGNPDKTIWVDVWVEEAQLFVRVSDQGSGFDLLNEKKRLESEGDLRIQGRGLHLMESIAKEVSFLGSGVQMIFASLDR